MDKESEAGPSKCNILRLFDPETEQVYNINVNSSDYEKANTDIEFAQRLLRYAKQNVSTEESEGMENAPNHIEKNCTLLWSYDAVICLINSAEIHIEDLSHPRKRKHVWTHINNDLLSAGYIYNENACHNKWRSLLRSYKTTKDKKLKSGRAPTRFQFYDKMDDILGNKPANACSHVLESIEETSDNNAGNKENKPNYENLDTSNDDAVSPPPKRRSNTKEYGKNKRHEERLAIEQQKIDVEKEKVEVLKKILDKLT